MFYFPVDNPIAWVYHLLMSNTNAAATKPCANCGDNVPVGILACAPCQREWMLQFHKTHAHLFTKERKAA
jgi:hypothetical protein